MRHALRLNLLMLALCPAAGRAADRAAGHWSFQPIDRPALPTVDVAPWVRNEVDRFVLARLERASLEPSREANRHTLIRRLSLDLTGFPPLPEQVTRFMKDNRPDAYERLVDRLLASPHFGERWGRYWLDLARYADSDGYEMDHPRPYAWRWRDWVIDAVNDDMPFDQFTIEQLAGDLLPDATMSQRIAAGFHRNTLTNRENGIDEEEFRLKAIVDRVNTTGTVWLGLTVGCAECHTHKYDPITQREYYELFAFFNNRVEEADIAVPPAPHEVEAYEREQAAHAERLADLEAALANSAPEEREKAEEAIKKHRDSAPELKPVAYGFARRAKPRATHVHVRGNFLEKGDRVTPGTPAVLSELQLRSEAALSSGSQLDRLDFARWIVDPANPLTARVAANRIWQPLFGAGLVPTPEDFGTQGAAPSHPELLDWLASELVRGQWSRKSLIRLIVTSATYRQSSDRRAELDAVDADNRLLARQNRYRLEAEIVRDQYLAASGLLCRQIGGPGFRPPLPEGLDRIGFRLAWRPDRGEEVLRRGMYILYHRNLAYPMLKTFDFPNSNVTCTRRERSNTPLQSLTQLNDPLFVEAARALAIELLQDAPGDQKELIERLFFRCLVRRPDDSERAALSRLFEELYDLYQEDTHAAKELVGDWPTSDVPLAERATWIAVSRSVMNLDEFVTRE